MSPRAIFIGMPGAGKSTVGRKVAHELGLRFADTDDLIAARGRSIATIFAEDGEEGFREIEADVISEAITHFDGVLSLGGGAVLGERTRELLRDQPVFLIEVDDDELIRRVSKSRTVRPLLEDDPVGGIQRLRRERSRYYHRAARHVVTSDSRGVRRVVEAVIKILNNDSRTVHVGGEAPYDVVIGNDLVSEIVHAVSGASSVLLLHCPDVSHFVGRVAEELTYADIPHVDLELPRGEAAKDLAILGRAWDVAGDAQIGRDGMVLAIGGGATTDVGGFIAASWLRGIPVVQVPTTLLGMVDAAVGGKTGINTSRGKNLVGAFHPPASVLCDVEVLKTLPEADLRAGFGEIIKCGFIRDSKILDIVEEHGTDLLDPQHPLLLEIVERAIQVKADVVSQDLHEGGLREILNYGHTLAHAIELGENYERRHGEAVSIGCVFAGALAESAGIATIGFTDHHRTLFSRVGLPVEYAAGQRDQLERAMFSDKKVRDGRLRFVVLSDIGAPEIYTAPSRQDLDTAFAAIGVK